MSLSPVRRTSKPTVHPRRRRGAGCPRAGVAAGEVRKARRRPSPPARNDRPATDARSRGRRVPRRAPTLDQRKGRRSARGGVASPAARSRAAGDRLARRRADPCRVGERSTVDGQPSRPVDSSFEARRRGGRRRSNAGIAGRRAGDSRRASTARPSASASTTAPSPFVIRGRDGAPARVEATSRSHGASSWRRRKSSTTSSSTSFSISASRTTAERSGDWSRRRCRAGRHTRAGSASTGTNCRLSGRSRHCDRPRHSRGVVRGRPSGALTELQSSGRYALSGCSTSVWIAPWAAPEPARPPPAPRRTQAAPTASAAPMSGPAT